MQIRRENRRLIMLGALIVLAVVVLTVGRQSPLLRPAITALMAPLRPIGNLLSEGATDAIQTVSERRTAAEMEGRMRELEQTVAELQVEIVRLREIEDDYYRLSGLVDYAAEHPDQSLVTADVIGRDTSSYLRWIMINRGTRDGIRVGNPVVSDLGLVGRVENVAANAAWIRLANDPASAIDAKLQNANAEGTVIGQLQGGLRMQYISQDATVNQGDLVLTSGLGGTFPANIVIGQVTSVQRQQADLFQVAEVRPTVDFDELRIVSVVTAFDPVDTSIFQEDIEAATKEEAP